MFDTAKRRGNAARAVLPRAWLCSLVLLVCAACPALADTSAVRPVVIGAVPGMTPPLDMAYGIDYDAFAREAPRGISDDAVNAVATALGAPPLWRFFRTRAALREALARGDIDMATGATAFDERAPFALSHPYLPIRNVLVEPLTKRGAATHRVAYVEGQTLPERLRSAYPSLAPAAYPDLISALLAVSFGDADACAGDMTAVGYTISHFDLPNLTVTEFAPLGEDGYRFAFARGRPDADTLRRRVDDALAALPPSFMLVTLRRWSPTASVLTRDEPIALTREEQAWLRAHPVVHYSMLKQAAPLMFADSQGHAAGSAVDVLDAIARVTGLRFEARMRTSTEQLDGDLRSGASLIVPYALSALPSGANGKASLPTGDGLPAIVTAVGQPPLRDAAALAGKRVAVPDYSPLRELVRRAAPQARIVDTRGLEGALHAVVKGDADAAVYDLAIANYAVGNPYRGAVVTSGVLSTVPVPHGLLVASGEPVLRGIVDRAIASLPPAELEAIRGRWKLAEHPEMLWARRRPQVEFGAFLGAALMFALLGWALTLRAQIVRRIAAEKAMRAAKEEAETANRAKSTFLATMSHEIRTPMNAVLGLLEMELRAPGERAETERALSTAHHAARDLLGMIDDLLDVAKIEAERLVLAPAPLEIEGWIAGVAAIYEPAARAKGVALVVERLGEGGPASLLADGQRLRQVVGNLLSNAIKFTDIGAVTLEYDVAPPRDGRRALTLAVSDTGVGIPVDKQALLFTPFVQAHDGRARSVGGTGLGLTISKRLVTMMDGAIELSSEPGRGTRFTVHVEFPEARAVASAAAAQATQVEAVSPSTASLGGLRVLVVDDHPANRIVLDRQIALLGGTAQLASDGKSALARWRAARQAFDVIVTDCSMPEMSGEELARAIRDDERRDASKAAPVPIVGLTANAQSDAAARAIASGMTACFVKPLGLDALRDALLAATRTRPAPEAPEAPMERKAQTLDAPLFDQALLASFGDQASALADTLKAANALDLSEARAAFEECDHARLRDLAHRMKGGSAVIGAAPFMRACVALQRDCERAIDEDRNGDEDVAIAASFATFVAAAEALDAALEAAPASRAA
ncbi:sensor protein evgS [Caballeronia hypogeia]|uniref:Virulence sensor protein BvgS n=1 Tax=Caballeronia hypogeia TaxID=1777140 RepID=A0A158BNI7_9BURK|nr:transporter substrate-binding domain-containing protein [Caballeronia hypogeia]SAK71613.1 sensor protein evgS [Caballeronia hypogeia]